MTAKCWTDSFKIEESDSKEYKSVVNAFHAVDWASTSLGALSTWDLSTRSEVCAVFKTSSTPRTVFLDEACYFIYNARAVEIYQGSSLLECVDDRLMMLDRHPYMMGKPYVVAWQDLSSRDAILEKLLSHRKAGKYLVFPPTTLRFKRDGQEEEVDVSWELIPLLDDSGHYSASSMLLTEHTRQIRAQQRANFLAGLNDAFAKLSTYTQLYETACNHFRDSELKFPLAAIFTSEKKQGSSPALTPMMLSPDYRALTTLQNDEINEWMNDALETQSPSWHVIRRKHPDTPLNILVYASENDIPTDHIMILAANPLHQFDHSKHLFLKSCCTAVFTALGKIASSDMLQQSETRFKEVLLRAPIGLTLEDATTRKPYFVNDACLKMFGVQGFDFDTEDSPFPAFIHDLHRESIWKEYEAVDKDHPMKNRDVRLVRTYKPSYNQTQHPDDNVWVRISSTWLPPSYQEAPTLLFSITDISEYKYLERVALEKMDRAVELQKLKSESTFERERANVAERSAAKHLQYIDFSSHELRNPLGAIIQAVELAADILEGETRTTSQSAQEVREYLSSIMICAKHMGRIVNDTLSFSQLDHGALQIALLPCDLDVTATEVMAMFKAELSAKQITLKSDIHRTGTVLTDPSRFSQILINMLTNALKFCSHDGTGEICVTLFSQVEHENKVRITCSVKDNGPGMTDSVLDTLFQKFSQASAKTHVQYGGSGLGLYISKRLVELLGGQISAKSSPGGGSDLRFYVICERPASVEGYTHAVHAPQKQEKVVDKIISLKKATGSRTATGIYSDHERPTLLVVEDNLVNQKLMVKLLSGKYNIRTANNGLECLALFKSSSGTSIDLVLCDIEMPVMDGYEAVRRVKEWQSSQGLRPVSFLAVSANSRPEQVQKMLDAGMDRTIHKPFGREEVFKVVQSMLEASRVD